MQIVTGVVWAAIIVLFSVLVSIHLTDILIEPLTEAGVVR